MEPTTGDKGKKSSHRRKVFKLKKRPALDAWEPPNGDSERRDINDALPVDNKVLLHARSSAEGLSLSQSHIRSRTSLTLLRGEVDLSLVNCFKVEVHGQQSPELDPDLEGYAAL